MSHPRPDPPGNRPLDPPGVIFPIGFSQRLDDCYDDTFSEHSIQKSGEIVGTEEYRRRKQDIENEDDAVIMVEDSISDISVKDQDSGNIQEMRGNKASISDTVDGFTPAYSQSNSIPFYFLCLRLETLLKLRTSKNRPSREKLFDYILGDNLRQKIGRGSYFPLLRLIVPDIDTSRPHTGMKEKSIATAWGEALGLSVQSPSFQRLLNFSDPTYFSVGSIGVGDLSCVIHEELLKRTGKRASKLTVGQINKLLDELVIMRQQSMRSNHDWKPTTTDRREKKGLSLKQKRQRWVEKLLHHNLSALEHKWTVRILLQKMEIGFSYRTVLEQWQPKLAMDLYRMNNNLKSVCTTLCNPNWIKRHRKETKRDGDLGRRNKTRITWMEMTSGDVMLGNTIGPMLALKAHFSNALAELCRYHREHVKKTFRKNDMEDEENIDYLPFQHPAIICEVKLDGERMVVHVQKGIVTMHSRRGCWYSNIYSPVLAPAIRRALSQWNDVSVILDGEVIAWDDGEKETIPFGNNRAVAVARRKWMSSQGLLDKEDLDLHQGETDLNVMNAGFHETNGVDHSVGSECWLQFEIFDVLYVGGEAATEIISSAIHIPWDEIRIGSIIHLNGFQRKCILYKLIQQQEKEIMIVPSIVIRPNGTAVDAEEYFTKPFETKGFPFYQVDSIEWWIEAFININMGEKKDVLDTLRGGLPDSEIGLRRAKGVDSFYVDIVENQGFEGILIKDLNASYLLDGRKYWVKHKPDYEQNAQLNDIDLLILGAYHGTGMGPSGNLNAFLLGCVDDVHSDSFLTLCRINGGGLSRENLDRLLQSTGYQKQTNEVPWDRGRWFREKDHGKTIPDFLSKRSFQNEDGGPPAFSKKMYPQLWIRPEDSVILTVRASEIVTSDNFQAGITLRFPRIERVRTKNNADDKSPNHVETVESLHCAYREQMQRREGSVEMESQSDLAGAGVELNGNIRRFYTAEEGLKRKIKRTRNNQIEPKWIMPRANRKDSSALEGLIIAALEGIYIFEDNSLDAEEAAERGWFETAKSIKNRDDLLMFISKHGGIPKISVAPDTDFVVGGSTDDARVIMHHNGLNLAIKQRTKRSTSRKVGLSSEDMIKIGGVLKWTFLISIVHQWNVEISRLKIENEEERLKVLCRSSIKYTHPHLLKPARHQYLITRHYKTGLTDVNNVYGISSVNDCTLVDFKRGLQEVNDQNKRDKNKRARLANQSPVTIPLQDKVFNVLEPSMRWSIAGPLQKFWPYKKCSQETTMMVFYPDIFEMDFGERSATDLRAEEELERWSRVSEQTGNLISCLPLTRLMGAQVTLHLHDGVTHVLCELVESPIIAWEKFNVDYFLHKKRARRIKTRLQGMQHKKKECRIHFVSPEWIRDQWDSTLQF